MFALPVISRNIEVMLVMLVFLLFIVERRNISDERAFIAVSPLTNFTNFLAKTTHNIDD